MQPSANLAPHRPTLGWAIVAIVVVVLGYHFIIKK
jgi:hypothetical protein